MRQLCLLFFSSDVSRSNCVICLCPDKRAVLQQAYNVLKVSPKNVYLLRNYVKKKGVKGTPFTDLITHFTQEGGELYFSDMYASKVVPDHMRDDPVLWGKTTNLKVIVKELIRCTADRP